MPELPEVETLRLGLKKYLVGKRIVDVEVRDKKLLSGDPQDVVGSEIKQVRRLAKGIIIDLSNNYSIALHIKLTGQLVFRDEKTRDLPVMKPSPSVLPNKFTRVILKLSGPSTSHSTLRDEPSGPDSKSSGSTTSSKSSTYLYFNEVRGFAWMKILKTDEIMNLPFFKSLGPEPPVTLVDSGSHFAKASRDRQVLRLTQDTEQSRSARMTLAMFQQIIKTSNLPIKVLLMEQKKIGGIGNIYANDACFDAKLDPRRRAKTLLDGEIKQLFHSIIKVLEAGLKHHGSSELNFVDVLGQKGHYQDYFLVYGKAGKKCSRDGGIIKKIYLGGRGTYFCERCQR